MDTENKDFFFVHDLIHDIYEKAKVGRADGHRLRTSDQRSVGSRSTASYESDTESRQHPHKKAKMSPTGLVAIQAFERAVDRMMPQPSEPSKKMLPDNAEEWYDQLNLTKLQREEMVDIVGDHPTLFMLASVELDDLFNTSLTVVQKKTWINIGKHILNLK